jgi:lipopolysaccharide export system permease protein
MRLLDRYLLRELLVPLGYCLSGFLLLWVTSDLINSLHDFQEHKLTGVDMAQYYLVRAPEFIVLVLPIGLLLALLFTLTNHARHNEITAIRAAGISLWRLSLPYLAVGALAGVALFVMNEFWVPDSADAAERIRQRYAAGSGQGPQNQVRKLGFTNARDQRVWQIGAYQVDTGVMINPVVISSLPGGARTYLYSDRAVRRNGVWTFYQARLYRESGETNALPVLLLQTNVLAMPELNETPEQIKSEIRISSNLNTLSFRNAKRADVPLTEIFNYLRLHPQPSKSDGAWLFTKMHGRLAAPWTCLVVVLMALPFGAASGRRNVFVGVASSIVICFAFFVLQTLCLALGAGGYLAPWMAGWLPNIVFGVLGLGLSARVR